jgi:hypothetical protein
MLGIFFTLTALYRGSMYVFVDVPRYTARTAAARQNSQLLASYNEHRTGDIITIVGKAVPISDPSTKAQRFLPASTWITLR